MSTLVDNYGLDELTSAVASRNSAKVLEIINKVGLSHNPSWINGYVPLCVALKNYANYDFITSWLDDEYMEIINILLNNHAQINYEQEKGNTPLHWAVISSKSSIVRELLQREADLNKKNRCNKNPFDLAIEDNKINVLAELLNYISEDNITADTYYKLLFDLINKNHANLAQKLLGKCHNFDINETNGDVNFLGMAVEKKFYLVVESLLARGVDVNYRDNTRDGSKTALITACKMGCLKMVILLLDAGADFNINQISFSNYYGSSYHPLHVAINNANYDIVKELLNRGDNVNRTYNEYNELTKDSALKLACNNFYGSEIAKLLIERNADINKRDGDGIMPICHAACNYDTGIFTCLTKNKNLKIDSINVRCLLEWSVLEESEELIDEIFQCLEKSKSHCYHRYKFEKKLFHSKKLSRTLLHEAARKNRRSSIDGLVKNGILVDFKNEKGRSPIHLAFRYKRLDAIERLLRNGSDINVKCNENYTPFDYMTTDNLQETRYDTDEEDKSQDDDPDCYEVRRDQDDDQDVIDFFAEHVIKMKCLNLHVDENNYKTAISKARDPFKNYKKYLEEIEAMKKEVIDKDITFYDIVTAKLNTLVVCLYNPIIFNTLSSKEYRGYDTFLKTQCKFPHYSIFISNAFHRGLARKKLLDTVRRYTIFDMIFKLPYPCQRTLLDCFSNLDLKNVIYEYVLNNNTNK